MSVKRRMGKRGLSECLCSVCGKWRSWGIVTGSREMPEEQRYFCPDCLDKAPQSEEMPYA